MNKINIISQLGVNPLTKWKYQTIISACDNFLHNKLLHYKNNRPMSFDNSTLPFPEESINHPNNPLANYTDTKHVYY